MADGDDRSPAATGDSAHAPVMPELFALPCAPVLSAWKGSILRGYRETLQLLDWLDGVYATVGPITQALLDDPPAAITWIPSTHTLPLVEAVYRLHGEAGVHRLSTQATDHGLVRLLRPALSSILRLSGASPATLLSRMGVIVGHQSRGFDFEWHDHGDRSGKFTVVSHGVRNLPSTVAMWAGGVGNVFPLTDTEGRISLARQDTDDEKGTLVYAVDWR